MLRRSQRGASIILFISFFLRLCPRRSICVVFPQKTINSNYLFYKNLLLCVLIPSHKIFNNLDRFKLYFFVAFVFLAWTRFFWKKIIENYSPVGSRANEKSIGKWDRCFLAAYSKNSNKLRELGVGFQSNTIVISQVTSAAISLETLSNQTTIGFMI